MKFKITVLSLLIAILGTCIFTSYKLIKETETQTKILMILGEAERDRESIEIGASDINSNRIYMYDRMDRLSKIVEYTK